MVAAENAPNVYAQAERTALADTLLEVGPDAPTLCEGWLTRDLAGHLVIREGRNLFAGFGIFLGPLKGYSRRKQDEVAARPWREVVETIRSGPPRGFGTMAHKPKVDGAMNTIEYFVHHEDVRRGAPGWAPRDLPAEQAEDIWDRLAGFGKRLTRKSPVGVRIRHSDGRELTVHEGPDTVTLVGDPGELVLYLFGRTEAQVEQQGDPAAITRLRDALGV